ncbi:MAG: DUF1800 domain-containing protein [Chitinophagaceae bacterium]|nr:DUF1800 domain-containing protein [Chitinophagaceae bacterium]
MYRRDFLSLGLHSPAANAIVEKIPEVFQSAQTRVFSGISPYTGQWTINEAVHLLKRTMFGAKKEDVDFLLTLTPDQAVDHLLSVPGTAPTEPVKNYTPNVPTTPVTDPDLALAPGASWVNCFTNNGGINSGRRNSYKAWWIGLLINQERNIQEKMVLFWHNHFATESADVAFGISCYKHNSTLRKYALGNFKDLVKAITLDPAMLRYLNGEQNRVGAPDENYARELQELFTVGKGPNSHYTEEDVKQAARVLTGYRIKYADYTTYFDKVRHDSGNKTFSAFYGNTTITGLKDAAGQQELDALLNMIFLNQEVALFIVRKLYRWFVYYIIDDATETNVIAPLAALFRSANYEIKPVVAALLKSEHFFDPLNQGCQIKSPLDTYIGLCREFSVKFPDPADYINSYYMWAYIGSSSQNAQQNLGDPPDVAGWKAYYQEPQYYGLWINSDTLPKRNLFTDTLINAGYSRNGKKIVIDAVAFAASMPNPGNPNDLINDSLRYLLRLPLSQSSKDQLKKDILLSGQVTDSYWTSAWINYVANPNDNMAYTTVLTRLKELYKYIMNLAEYQLS